MSAEKLRAFIKMRLEEKGDMSDFSDSDALFTSSRLDSLDAVQTILFLETNFKINFAQIGFDQTFIDSINAMKALIKHDS